MSLSWSSDAGNVTFVLTAQGSRWVGIGFGATTMYPCRPVIAPGNGTVAQYDDGPAHAAPTGVCARAAPRVLHA